VLEKDENVYASTSGLSSFQTLLSNNT